jgi:hypothetical protein
MTTFDDRKDTFEARFRPRRGAAVPRRGAAQQALGLWAAGLMGLTGEEAEAYAREVISSDFQEAGDGDVLRKVHADLRGKADEAAIRAKMQSLLADAKAQVMSETGRA